MLICDVCGKLNPEGNTRCDHCGAPLAGAEVAPVTLTSPSLPPLAGAQSDGLGPSASSGGLGGPVCPKCKRSNRPGSVYCAHCGYNLVGGDAPASPAIQYGAPAPSAHPTVISPAITGNLPSGTVLKRRYRILRKIAQGGMGAVYEAIDLQAPLGTRWAVKEISPAALPPNERSQAIADFRREAQMLATLSHPNLPKVVETFEEMGKHFLVMEFIPGRTLLNVTENTQGFIPEQQVMVWARQIFDVLNYLHSQNPPIIYRDLKPANVMLVEGTERIKLIDFGIARFHKQGKSHDTEAFGTAGYAPPEQYGKGQTDQRSDVYALAATLHHVLTKHDASLNPFNWLPVRRYNPALSMQLERALQTALNLDPARRFQSIRDFGAALGINLPPAGVSAGAAASLPAPAPAPVRQEPARPQPRQPRVEAPAPAAAPQPMPMPTNGSGRPRDRYPQRAVPQTIERERPVVPSIPVAPMAPMVPVAQAAAPAMPVPAAPAPSRNGPPSVDITSPGQGHTGTSAPQAPRPAPAMPIQTADQAARMELSQGVIDLGDVRWNTRPARRVALRSADGKQIRGSVISSQPWIAFYPPSFQGSVVNLDVRVKKGALPYGRTELHVPNVFAIIWRQTRGLLPFIGCWFWLLLMVASSVGIIMLWGLAAFLGAMALLQALFWVWSAQARWFVPADRVNTGRLLVKSTGGDRQIEVRAVARPSWGRKALGWTLALLLFVAEVVAIAWIGLAVAGVRVPVPWL